MALTARQKYELGTPSLDGMFLTLVFLKLFTEVVFSWWWVVLVFLLRWTCNIFWWLIARRKANQIKSYLMGKAKERRCERERHTQTITLEKSKSEEVS